MSDRHDEFVEAAYPAPEHDDPAGHRPRVREPFLGWAATRWTIANCSNWPSN